MFNVAEDHKRQLRREKYDLKEKESKAQVIDTISEGLFINVARKSFMDKQTQNTEQHIADVARASGYNRRAKLRDENQEQLDEAFKRLETEWKDRRQELIASRRDLSNLQKNRISRLVSHIEEITAQGGGAEAALQEKGYPTELPPVSPNLSNVQASLDLLKLSRDIEDHPLTQAKKSSPTRVSF